MLQSPCIALPGAGLPSPAELASPVSLTPKSAAPVPWPTTPTTAMEGLIMGSPAVTPLPVVTPSSTPSTSYQTASPLAKLPPVKYGELIVLGYNGSLLHGDKGRHRSKIALCRRPTANGVRPVKHHVVKNPRQCELIRNVNQHSVSYTMNRSQAVIVQYDHDDHTDMFHIGRSSELPIDFVVTDTVPGDKRQTGEVVAQSTISRFACRIIIERNPPHTARIYAAGFDSEKNIFLGEKATKWYSSGDIDGLTTNGVLVMHPRGEFSRETGVGMWREVSLCGHIYALRDTRSTPQKSSLVESESNVLVDGSLIDLCGATLLWRSAEGLLHSPTQLELDMMITEINVARPQCPVGLNTLMLPTKSAAIASDRQPYVYISCGHVHGQHSWGRDSNDNTRTCPMCMMHGPFVKLLPGLETSVCVDKDPPTHCFRPCGHMASEATVRYWTSLPIPHGCLGFRAVCPFCAVPLTDSPGYVKLIFQDHVD